MAKNKNKTTIALNVKISNETGHIISPSHTYSLFLPDRFREIVKRSAETIMRIVKKHPNIQALAGCGQSGLLMLGALSYETGLPTIAVRKKHEDVVAGSAYKSRANGQLGCGGYLIVDDLIDSGSTLNHIRHEITQGAVNNSIEPPDLVAVFLYQQHSIRHDSFEVEGGKKQTTPVYYLYGPRELYVWGYDD